MKPAERRELFARLSELNPKPTTELEYSTPFELLVAVTLSAQATDVGVNKATRRLFPVANTPEALLALGEEHAHVWQALDEEEIKEISQAMASLGNVAAAVVEDLLVEFVSGAAGTGSIMGSFEQTQKLLNSIMPPEKVDALMEEIRFDSSGQMLTATFMDYALPRAVDIPNFHFETRNVPCVTNAIGVKGAGEAGAIGACPAVMNAMVDALNRAAGVKTIDMPATPPKVFATLKAAGYSP